MPSATTTNTRPPPPTTNKLDAVQRARVMRSSRKLGAVLGTTPFLLESCGSTVPVTLHHASSLERSPSHTVPSSRSKHHHRQCSVFEQPRTSSESLPSLLPSHASSSSKDSLVSISESSTEESVSAVPFMLAVRSQHPGSDERPLILVNSVPISSSDSHAPASILSPLTTSFVSADISPLAPTSPIEVSRAETRRRKMARVVRTLGEKVPPELVFPPSDLGWPEKKPLPSTTLLESRSAPRKLSNPKANRRRSASVGSNTHWQRLLDLSAPVFSSSSKAPEDQRWVGEWNRRNIAQVQRELRSLRQR